MCRPPINTQRTLRETKARPLQLVKGTKPKEARRLFDEISVWPRTPTLSVWVLLILIVNDHQVIQAEEREASANSPAKRNNDIYFRHRLR